jgi:WD40 repeat protein
MDHPIFLAREEETHQLASLVAVYRGVMLYGDSGAGKSSLINAALLPRAKVLGFHPERLRVQPRRGQELVIERIATAEDDAEFLPSLLAPDEDSSRIVLSTEAFEERLRAACQTDRPLIVFDQFEEILTLFDEAGAAEEQQRVVELIYTLLREPLPVKLVFAFREDHLGKVKQLLAASPELVDQSLRLTPPSVEALPTIIRGPFERHPGHFQRELSPEVAEHLREALAVHFGAGDLSLSEVQTVCLRLWQADDPDAMLAERGVQGVLEDYLGEALDAFPDDLRGAAIALLSQMVTSAGTRNVMSAEDLMQRVLDEDDDIPRPLLEQALERLESESRLVRRERRRDLFLYEITSEFLLPWIRRRRDEFRGELERQRERRRIHRLLATVGVLLLFGAVVGGLAVWALKQRSNAEREADTASALALASSAEAQLETRPDISLELALAAHKFGGDRAEVRNSMIGALASARRSGAVGMLHGHTSAVRSVAFARDGQTLISASDDRAVRRWDARTKKPLGEPLAIRPSPFSISLGPDGRTVASSSFDDDSIRFWDARTGEQLGKRLKGQTATNLAFSRNGRILASAGFETSTITDSIRLWDVRGHRLLGRFRSPTEFISDQAFSPSGRILATGGDDDVIRLWDVRARRQIGRPLKGHNGDVYSVEFSRDGRRLVSVGGDDAVRIWDVRSHRQLGSSLPNKKAAVATFSPDGRMVASTGDKTVRLWDARTHRQIVAPLTGHTETVSDVAFSPDGRTLASGSVDRVIRLWDIRAEVERGRRIPALAPDSVRVAFSRDGETLASTSDGEPVRLWDVATRRELEPPLAGHRGSVIDMAFSPDGETFGSAGLEDNKIRLWDLDSHEQIDRTLTGHSATALAFSPDGERFVSAGAETESFEQEIWLWDVDTRARVARIPNASDYVYDLAFRRGGRIVASADDDMLIRLWDLHTEKQIRPALRGHTGSVYIVAFSPDGRMLASGGDDTIRLWDVRTHREIEPPLSGHTGSVYDLAFSRNGRTLASVGDDRVIRLWDVRAHRQLGRPLEGHRGTVSGVSFSSDGRTLNTVGGSTIQVWEKIFWRNFDQLRTEVCKLVGGSLSRAEWTQFAPGIDYQKTCP